MSQRSGQPSHGRRSRWKMAVAGAAVAVAVAGGGAACSAGGGGAPRAAHAATSTAPAAPSRGYSPQMVRRAYGVSPLLRKGIDGRGETVVLPENDPLPGGADTHIRQDLAAFDKRYHLPRVDLTLSREPGFTGQTSLASSEEVQDAEMVHTIAPGAKITIMATSLGAFSRPPELARLFRAAAQRGNIVSFSQSECQSKGCLSAGQLRSLDRALRYARDRHVSIFSSAGDSGAAIGKLRGAGERGVLAPASSPLVTGVGGTTLAVHHDGVYGNESAWNDDVPGASSTGARLSAGGGGVSARYARPGYQHGLPVIGDHRGVPDVAAVAEPGMMTLLVHDGHEGIFGAGGTSESAPLWAGIAALADQDAHRQLGFLNAGLYRIGHSTVYHRAFHDVTHGNNTVTTVSGKNVDGYRARPGWDPVTGWGSPNAQVLVPLLGKEVRPGDGRGL
jgi:subtilase family serine protease